MGDYLTETEAKTANDLSFILNLNSSKRCIWVPSPLIIGAGPSGLAAAACLKQRGVPSLILERSNCIASLWQHKTYDRLKLHLPKHLCELPFMEFPQNYPTYPSKQQFVEYLQKYADKFDIRPVFNQRVVAAEFDRNVGFWRVTTEEVEYVCQWLIVATGENAEEVVPAIEGMTEFGGAVVHASGYKSGEGYKGKKVLVVGCGNSGMEVALDLCNHDARPSLVVRDAVHILPKEILGRSTFGVSMWLLKLLPVQLVDRLLLALSWVMIGDTARFGIGRPTLGPLQLKTRSGKTPVLDVGTVNKIKTGDIKVVPGIKKLRHQHVEFVDGTSQNFDAIILATGYKSNVPSWLKESEMFSKKDGFPKSPFPNGWKGENELYAVGFTKRGLIGASMDAKNIAEEIERCWRGRTNNLENHFLVVKY